MTDRIKEASPRLKARLAGAFQLLEAITATFGQVIVLDRLVVAGGARDNSGQLSWDMSGYFGWGSHPPSSGLRSISPGRFSSMCCLNL